MSNATPDWILSKVIDRGPRVYYRYRVEGVNLSACDERDRKFVWDIPQDPVAYHRYDLTNAEVIVQQ